jgi:thiamine pyrophosphokinase
MDKICCIISGGDINRTLLQENKTKYDCFIAADSGFEKAVASEIYPSVLVGDFDSIGQNAFQIASANPGKMKIIPYPVDKDFSDTHLAIEEGIKLGYTHFHVYGALGGDRFSHSISNLQTLCFMAKKGIHVTLIGEKEIIYLIENETLTLTPTLHSTFSVFPYRKKQTVLLLPGPSTRLMMLL